MELHVSPKKLEIRKLSNLDIIRAILFEKQKYKKEKKSKREPGISVIANILATKIEDIYRKLDGNVIQKDKIKKKICEIYKLRKSLLKFPRAQRYHPGFSSKMEKYRQLMLMSLDVSRKRFDMPKRKKKIVRGKMDRIENVEIDTTYEDQDESSSDDDDDNRDSNYEPTGRKSSSKKKKDLSEIIETQCRYGASGRGAHQQSSMPPFARLESPKL